jgi:hypothetical protein
MGRETSHCCGRCCDGGSRIVHHSPVRLLAFEVLAEEDRRHAAAPQLALDPVAVGERGAQRLDDDAIEDQRRSARIAPGAWTSARVSASTASTAGSGRVTVAVRNSHSRCTSSMRPEAASARIRRART